jgi:hypothetical protein
MQRRAAPFKRAPVRRLFAPASAARASTAFGRRCSSRNAISFLSHRTCSDNLQKQQSRTSLQSSASCSKNKKLKNTKNNCQDSF